jgi:hypothetical protein
MMSLRSVPSNIRIIVEALISAQLTGPRITHVRRYTNSAVAVEVSRYGTLIWEPSRQGCRCPKLCL